MFNRTATEHIINYHFRDKELLELALSHSSYAYEQNLNESNEKLEFLGDAILGSIITNEIYHRFTHLKEGDLSKLRSALVNEDSLYQLAVKLKLNEILKMGKGEKDRFQKGESFHKSIMADAFEALIGAIYLDSSFRIVSHVFLSTIDSVVPNFFNEELLSQFDSKSQLQELTLKHLQILPEYRATAIDNKTFEVELFLAGESIDKVKGSGKKKLEKILAENCLKNKIVEKIVSKIKNKKTSKPGENLAH